MKQLFFTALVFAGIVFWFSSCSVDDVTFDGVKGNGNITSQQRTAVDFSGVVLNIVGNVNIHFNDTYKVVVVTDSNIQDFITINVNNNLLYISDTNEAFETTKLEIDIYMPLLKEINNRGVGDINVDNGNIDTLKISHSGVGNIDAQNYQGEHINIINSGVGDVKIWATKTLTGKLSGVGNIFYKGSPVNDITVNGIGNVEKL